LVGVREVGARGVVGARIRRALVVLQLAVDAPVAVRACADVQVEEVVAHRAVLTRRRLAFVHFSLAVGATVAGRTFAVVGVGAVDACAAHARV